MGLFDFFKKKKATTIEPRPAESRTTTAIEEPQFNPQIRRAADITSIQRNPSMLARVELYCQTRGAHFDDQVKKINFFIEERENNNDVFKEVLQVVEVLENKEFMRRVEIYAKVAGKNFSTPGEMAAFFVKERNSGSDKFKETFQVVSLLEDTNVMKKAMYYAKLVGEEFKTPEALAAFFVKERNSNERFRELFSKVVQISEILSNEQMMENAKALAKINDKTFESPFELAEFYVSAQQKQTTGR